MMQNWFEEAKLGIFIHWGGIYAIDRRGGESWPIVREDVSYNDYMKQMEKFNADQYDPTAWADLIERSGGAKYAVLTTKHHDGVTLWPTKEEGPCIPRDKGIGDLVGPYLEAIREKGLKTGLYFSHTDWTHLDHFSVITGLSEEEIIERRKERTHFNSIWQESFDSNASLPESYNQKWINFLEFEKRQLSELLGNYGPIDLIWFDVMLERPGYSYRCEEIRNHIHSFSDKTVINSRLGDYGDYETPEQFIPVYPPEGPWEVCMTSNNTWSYTGAEKMYKSLFEIIAMFCECLSMGGNLLLNVGPDEHGIIPDQQIELLEGLGKWVHKHEEAIYETKRGLPHGYSYGLTSLNSSEDVLYLYLPHFPDKGTSIKGIRNDIESITVLGNGASCSSKRVGGAPWLNVPGTLFINVPEEAKDQEVTVLKIVLDGKLDLYNGVGVEIDVN